MRVSHWRWSPQPARREECRPLTPLGGVELGWGWAPEHQGSRRPLLMERDLHFRPAPAVSSDHSQCPECIALSRATDIWVKTGPFLAESFRLCLPICFTLSAVPSAAPGNVSAVAVSSTQILLTWASVPEQDQNGLILGYKVRVRATSLCSRRAAATLSPPRPARFWSLGDRSSAAPYSLLLTLLSHVRSLRPGAQCWRRP